jgi:DNA integrity scanning protein DisA with diadenylate cyclase activity
MLGDSKRGDPCMKNHCLQYGRAPEKSQVESKIFVKTANMFRVMPFHAATQKQHQEILQRGGRMMQKATKLCFPYD